MAKNQNTFEKMRREADKKRKANEKRARKQLKNNDGAEVAAEPATQRQAVRRLTDAEILRMARNA
ncbi:hypothetical protein [Botrimarina mediterranea]|uniref:Uncharacterized protein n=1 Tax=Botrimarina mediterranea TaxID=2528022 RepID=A0A518K677_9BACT|nr:hypothetical protein [Botrimarina mediterranea]QDV73295.1 hypothetical protein Spa11_14910 [Botrimarina mediterranea]QDV77812.1 hypothetical protein K2D_14170 [Planctomycetes bacterium K2D]